jgi:hypothetical protein
MLQTVHTILLTLGALNILVEAHMKVNVPSPYGKSTLNNSPLLADGTDFPCKQRPGVYESEGVSNIYALGSTNPLSFVGQAVHGGGSCQISITYDSQPTRNSVWKVIRSIEGGCPAQNQAGNMGNDPNAADPYQYDFTIPSDIPAGSGTIAWTWFNKIGNREMYMNCGPLTLTGTGGAKKNFDDLPDMFVANINNGCSVPDSKDVAFPEPGKSVTRMNGGTDAFAAPTGSCSPARNTQSVSTPGLTTVISSTLTTSFSFPNQTQASATGGTQDSAMTCTNEGWWHCINGTSFRRCASGRWSLPQPLAVGTSCTLGIHENLS